MRSKPLALFPSAFAAIAPGPGTVAAAVALAALLAAPAVARAQLRADDPPTVLERIEEKLRKNPELGKLIRSTPPQMEEVAWMTGDWDVVQKRFETPLTPARVVKGKRRAAVELGGRWLVARDTYEDRHEGRSYLGFLAHRATWAFQLFTSDGLVTMAPIVSQNPWAGGRLELAGTLWFASENAQVALRITRMGPDSFLETWEEILAGGRVRRPIVEYALTRPK